VVFGGFYANSVGAGYTVNPCTGIIPNYQWANDTAVQGFVYVSTQTQTCTPAVTFNGTISGNDRSLIFATVWHGYAAYPLAFPLKGYEYDTTPYVQSGITIPNYDSSDTIVSLAISQQGPNSCPGPQSSTFTADTNACHAPGSDGAVTIQTMYNTGSTPSGSPYTNTIGTANVNEMWSYYLILRPTAPLIGAIQIQGCTTAAYQLSDPSASFPCTFPLNSVSGHMIEGEMWDGQNVSTISAASGSTSIPCSYSASAVNENNYSRKFMCGPIPSGLLSPVTVKLVPNSGTANYDIIIKEIAGMSASRPLAGSSINFLISDGGSTSTTQSVGPVNIWETNNYYLDGFTLGPQNTLEQWFFQASAPFSLAYQFRFSNGIFADYDAFEDVSSVPQSISFSATTGPALYPSSYLFAWDSAPSNHPTVIEGTTAYSSGDSLTFPAFNNPETNAGAYVCVTANGGTAGATASWGSLTTIDASGGSYVGYSTTFPPGGVVTFTGSSGDVLGTVQKIRNLGTLDTHTFASASGGSVGPVNATSSSSNEWAEMCGGNIGSSTGTYSLPTFTGSTLGTVTSPNLSDQVGNTTAEAFLPTAGTYGASWAIAAGFTAASSVTGDTAIFFTTTAPSPTNTNYATNGDGSVN
jgi:hypothetical protein